MQLLAELASAPDEVASLLKQASPDRLAWVPPSWEGIPGERFTALEQACHLRDIEVEGYHVRFGRTLRENRPDLASIDSYTLAEERNYEAGEVEAALAAFRKARRETVAMLQTIRPDDWERRATFAEYGEVTLRGLAHILRSHDLQHLACLHWLLAKMA
ncbi:MAG TPA: DinB family protein [Dongiaceae bacterium]|nr:DinB family protein [Dongiaceae bacterium]